MADGGLKTRRGYKIIMVNYEEGKIYKIVTPHSKKVYIGSTCTPTLARRLAKHKTDYDQYKQGKRKTGFSSFQLLDLGDCDIVLLENYPCENKDELRARERYWLEKTKNTVNQLCPIRSQEEHKQYYKDYLTTYYQENKQKWLEYAKKRRNKINAYNSSKVTCQCGTEVTRNKLSRHKKTTKHRDLMEE